ncbi:putative LPS assembly protein LptD [Pedobacter metabolipauper]|uniref:LPS-assembly protein LptD central domain-containing protein n=1 Tax=Pedobacter metabolipauper TaxID=425513 RepID=A0A4R6T406_9SPHI|nr:putative LPS assembly protein LptD [Pedobacter metabolipauper]TDQ12111.1 hypothetical protein ATK78_1242 [Pedobacter metabolipauper]
MSTSVGNQAFAFSSFSSQHVFQQRDTIPKKKDPIPVKQPVPVKQNDTIPNAINAQNKPTDTLASEKLEYTAQDSVKFDKETGIAYLYGKARVMYQGFELDAEYIRFNTNTNQVYARGKTDAKGKYIGRPILKMEGQGTSYADSLSYNTKTGAGNIYGVFTEQEGGFFSGGKAKKQPDDEIHSKGQTYSTCNLPHPHFGIYITKGIVTENYIITGPVYLKIEDVPLPLGLPFAFFPKPNKKTSGFILPSPGEDFTRGFFLRDAGYYLGLNDYWDAKFLATIYTRGSYDGSLMSNYMKRYKHSGNVNLRYSNSRYGTEGTADFRAQQDFNILWSHNQNANSKPGTTFSASVNAGTSSFNARTAGGGSYDPSQIAQNTMQSSIAYGRVFDNGINFASTIGGSQETAGKTVTLNMPTISLSVPTFSPFDSKDRVGDQKWYQKISVGYTLNAENTLSTTESQLFQSGTLSKFRNGAQHNIPINMGFNVLRYFNFNLGGTYIEKWHVQTIRKTYLRVLNGSDVIKTDTVNGFRRNAEYSASMGLSTKVYSTAQFTKFGNFSALRHVMTPSVSFAYRPDFSNVERGYYQYAKYTDGTNVKDTRGEDLKYSIFENTRYGGPGLGRSAAMNFSLDNTIEAKILTPNDTTGKGEKKIPIIQGLGINGNYDFLAKSYKLSTLSFSGRSQFTDKLGINFYGTLDPYQYRTKTDSITGLLTRELVDRYTWQAGKLPRLTSFGFTTSYSLNPDALKRRSQNEETLKEEIAKKAMTPEQAEALALVSRDPNAFVDFKIPWNFAFSYTFNYNTDRTGLNSTVTNTLSFNGDANITPNWKVQFTSGWDFKVNNFSYTSFAIYRDLHCWDMSINWVPFGTYQSYSIDIKVKASVLQDLKLSKRKQYFTRF